MKNVLEVMRMSFNKQRMILEKCLIVMMLIILSSSMVLLRDQVLNKPIIKNINDSESTPTFYLHGFGGAKYSENYMVNSAVQKGDTNEIIEAKVKPNGKVRFEGTIDPNAKRPMIKILLEDNKNKNVYENARWIKNVIYTFNAMYHFEKFNFVAHSMGNQSFSYYMLNYGDNQQLPKLNKQVSLAGNFNGEVDINGLDLDIEIDKRGKPNKMLEKYRNLLTMKDHYPRNSKVLNIYGDLKDGTNSDGKVTNVSSKSLKYLLPNQHDGYIEYKVNGPKAKHSELPHNVQVIDKVNEFLWSDK
ncbi:alpha/beta hydrolase [Staphylococcus nepalensis]|uniref:alpha/beta hydrolase n=2 Tax=Staphylococcus nepalensis TaxID=214473 RepID=UPI0024B737C5|nr:alpha/beta hydrolase [Staphylococcus nepalensis]MDR5650518.1 alpha/beta hydrolase [Staphylococcus nepalensis]